MSHLFFCQFGVHGQVGLFESRAGVRFPRGAKVVCRTSRGIEAAIALNDTDDDEPSAAIEGELLRPFTVNDELLAERLARYQTKAFQACVTLLAKRGIDIPLVDAELLHDGEHLFFYFLGDDLSAVEPIMVELADRYGRKIRLRSFAEKLANGCGPGCGTTASSCGSGACNSCGVSGHCTVKNARPTFSASDATAP